MFIKKRKNIFSLTRFIAIICVVFLVVFTVLGHFLTNNTQDKNAVSASWVHHISETIKSPVISLEQWVHRHLLPEPSTNEQLKQAFLKQKQDYNKILLQNKKLKQLLLFKSDKIQTIATGRIVIPASGLFSKIIRVNTGYVAGVMIGDVAVTSQGLVGKIIEVSKYYADILPINHATSKIAGIVPSHNVKILIGGRHQAQAVAEYATEPLLLKSGDTVVSVSDGGSLPADIVIGTIDNPSAKPIKINLSVDFNYLDYIQIIRPIFELTDENIPENTDTHNKQSTKK